MSDQIPTPPDRLERTLFSLPAALFQTFPDRPVILRTADPAEPPTLLGPEVPDGLAFIQLMGLTGDMAPLMDWGEGLALDLVMVDPVAELPWLYRCTGLLARHPVRVSIPFRPGLARAVKLALSLGFAVRLNGQQPTPEMLTEIRQALEAYLHNPTVAQPVEPFHSLLLAFLDDAPVALWSLLEQDPAELCVIDDQGQTMSDQGPASVTVFRDTLVDTGAECRDCAWLSCCGGYFKWPRIDYACADVKRLFSDIQAAATELRAGLDAHAAARG
ncbi:hypothetical protein G3480_19545 [Thiorhodococcus mannitoliphagus]|uniref:Uncharacterized protein n=1 Tax=Thiorhodococcus mannitoliphagus TaxID=329406 RepID=A0A6P1E371_9GAMM|nr:hypothetical protein [Thiorhodococcus mannitoliphagus]NEX22474.1 hypothetical protein [Thiorhodococcus mannitoliphagus]